MPGKRSFPGLSAHEFQHPHDVTAIRALSSTPGLDALAKFASESVLERLTNIECTGHYVRVDETQYASLYRRYVTLAERMDLRQLPALYVNSSAELNATAQGISKYWLVLHTCAIKN